MPPVDNRRDFESEWPVCREVREDGFCRGVAAGDTGYCLRHLDSAGRIAHLASLAPGDDLDLRGVAVNARLLGDVLAAYRDETTGRPVFGAVDCGYAWFTERTWFEYSEIRQGAEFGEALFSTIATFDGVSCAGAMSFVEAQFEGEVLMESMGALSVDLSGAVFAGRVAIVTGAALVECEDARFDGGLMLATEGQVAAKNAHFGGPSTIAGATMVTVKGADVGNLVLSEVDLSGCSVLGAHRLEQLRIDGRTRYASPEKWWQARRRMLFEEGKESPARVAALYRALRKSFEDSKNEAGAGDFYYGEMECRRHSKESPVFERVILWFYWLLSGYGQRASRALAALLVVVIVVTGLLTLWGQDFGLAARTALGAVVFRDDRLELTAAGEWTVLVARFLGPVLLALAVLAVRARVKR